jgi:hypothetical protein
MTVRYIRITKDIRLFKPATRSFGDIAIVGVADAASTGPKLTPIPVTNPTSVSDASNAGGADKAIDDAAWFKGSLGSSVVTAFKQTPGPTTIWAIRVDTLTGTDLDAGLKLVAKLDVQFVVLANRPINSAADGKTEIETLTTHVKTVSNTGADGKERMGVAMLGKGLTDVTLVSAGMSDERMILVAHKADEDAAAAVAGTIAGYEPHISALLKQVSVNMNDLFSDSEIDAFNTAHINWITDPVLIPGRGLFMGEGYTLGTDAPYVDIIREVDDLSFRLKAALIRSIGNLRVTRSGLRTLASQMAAVLQPEQDRGVIESYDVFMPLQVLLDKEPSTLSLVELQRIANAQASRTVDAVVSVNYAGAIHRLNITLRFV